MHYIKPKQIELRYIMKSSTPITLREQAQRRFNGSVWHVDALDVAVQPERSNFKIGHAPRNDLAGH